MKRKILNYYSIIILICTSFACKSGVNDFVKRLDGGPVVPRNAERLLITDFRVKAGNQQIPLSLVQKIKEFINLDGRLTVVEKGTYDLLLKGEITGFFIQNTQYGEMGRPIKKRMRLTVSVILINQKRNKMIFYERDIQAFKSYSDVVPPIEQYDFVLDDVIEQMAKRISSKILSGWYTKHLSKIEKGKR